MFLHRAMLAERFALAVAALVFVGSSSYSAIFPRVHNGGSRDMIGAVGGLLTSCPHWSSAF